VKGAAVGAKDAVMNTIGMGGGTTNGSANVPAKDTSTYKPATRDY
jgi:cell division GTPase FtsZ